MSQMKINKTAPRLSGCPMLLNFQNGYVTDDFNDQECVFLRDKSTISQTVVTAIDNIVYAGEEQQEDTSKTVILARNRNTGKVRLIEVVKADMKPVNLNTYNSEEITLPDARLDLTRKFGSRKHVKNAEQWEKSKLNIETVTEQMQDVIQNIDEKSLDLTSYSKTDDDDFYIPPINRDAANVEEVYDIDAILKPEEYDQIYSEIKDSDYLNEMTPIIKEIISKRPLSNKEIVLAVYADCLIKLYLATMVNIRKKIFVLTMLSNTLQDIIFNNFVVIQNGKRFRPLPYKDRSLCYAMVFILMLNNYKFDLKKFCDTVKITPAKAILKVKVIAATVVTSSDKKTVQLKLPLYKMQSSRKSLKF